MLKKIINYCLWVLLFLVPWQTRWIYDPGVLNGGYWEYGTASFYGAEILLWVIIFIFSWNYFFRRAFLQRLIDKKRFRQQRWSLLIGVVAILLFMLLLGRSVDSTISYNHFLWVLEGLCILVIMVVSWDGDFLNWRHGLTAFWLGAVGQGIFAIWQFIVQYVPSNKWFGLAEHYPWQLGASVIESEGGRYLRAYGSLGGSNPLGIYLALGITIGLLMYFGVKKWRYKIALTIGQMIILTGLFFSFSRGAWVAAAIGLIGICLIVGKYYRYLVTDLIRQIFYYVMAAVVLAILFWPLLSVRVDINSRLEMKSLVERRNQLSDAVDIFVGHPLLGVGEGAYTFALYQKYPDWKSGAYQPVHNIYILMFVELGLVGGALFIALYVWLFVKILKNNLLFAPVILTVVTAGMFDHWLWSVFPGVLTWWLVWGLGLMHVKNPVDKGWTDGGRPQLTQTGP